ncbi:C6 zinc finger domain protein [Akanthomyces lecanii RCEF 1005]|uniref:C6 zinc finger domain protein n=1 Tax=Akanthomyces lecanii RCEF 1005 TaxID=1081108 RepID=A0A167RSW1_CORDF|nr:C6 zinc finger domain protein [Akanthomyces lecanii RCEF 1005]
MSSEPPEQHGSKRRRRPAKSCDACRARKVRCDQKTPCGPCTKARSAPKCVYGPETVRLLSPEPTPEESGPVVGAVSHLSDAHRQPASTASDTADLEDLRRQLTYLQRRIDNLESKVEVGAANIISAPAPGLRVAPLAPKLRQTADKNKLFGANH